MHDTDYERIKAVIAAGQRVSPQEYAMYQREKHMRQVAERQRQSIYDVVRYWDKSTRTDDLPLFIFADNRIHKCPHCATPITFSELGQAHRWGWCPYCPDSSGIGHVLPDIIILRLHKYGVSMTRSIQGD